MFSSHTAEAPINKRDDAPLKACDGTIILLDTVGVGIYFMNNFPRIYLPPSTNPHFEIKQLVEKLF
ncbi:hypothetical protein ACTXT7_000376 [Hymenolepis weldensis]